jgi:hypothetical protein
VSVSVYAAEWIVSHVAIQIQGLRIIEVRVRHVFRLVSPVGRHESSHAGAVVPRSEIVVAGFDIAFFAGEMMFGRELNGASATQVIAKGQAGARLLQYPSIIRLGAAGAESICQMEVE